MAEHEQPALERHLAASGPAAHKLLHEDPSPNKASNGASEVPADLLLADPPARDDFPATAEDVNALPTVSKGLPNDITIRQSIEIQLANASPIPVELRHSTPVPQRKLTSIPLVDQRALPVDAAAPPLVRIESVAKCVAFANLMQEV
jgi:hypothetical protein